MQDETQMPGMPEMPGTGSDEKKPTEKMNPMAKSVLVWVVIIGIIATVVIVGEVRQSKANGGKQPMETWAQVADRQEAERRTKFEAARAVVLAQDLEGPTKDYYLKRIDEIFSGRLNGKTILEDTVAEAKTRAKK